MEIDSKDLIPLDLSEFKFGGWFYLKVDDTDYLLMKINEKEVAEKMSRARWREWLKINKPNLFTYREGKWCTISGRRPDWEEQVLQR